MTKSAEQQWAAALGTGPTRAVRRVAAASLGGRTEAFYEASGGEPVVVTGLLDGDATLGGLDLAGMQAVLAGVELEGYSRETSERETFSAGEFFAELRSGRARHNVVDHPVASTPLRGRVGAPPFFGSNWIADGGEGLTISPLSLTLTPAGNFTPLHVDSYGMQGWMLLLEGLKCWRFVAPEHSRPRMDPVSADVGDAPPSAWNGVERLETELRGGELMFIPPGWAHVVWTPEASVGVGGSVLNEHVLEATLASWHSELALGHSDEVDVAALAARAIAVGNDAPSLRRGLTAHDRWQHARS